MFKHRQQKPPPLDASQLGFRSGLVLAKIGFELRKQYDDTISEPLPQEFACSLDSFEGPEPDEDSADVISLMAARQSRERPDE